jgi:receptor protein-tyrosine kinase
MRNIAHEWTAESDPNSAGPRWPNAHDPADVYNETKGVLRTEILLRQNSGTRSAADAVISPNPQEGRSYLAARLAIAFAQLGHPTLLVDADLRNPRQHVLFDASNKTGLSDMIRNYSQMTTGTNWIGSAQKVTNVPDLYLLCSGSRSSDALELLSHAHFEMLLEAWRSNYQCIVFDTPPSTLFADSMAVAPMVGQVIPIARAGRTSTSSLKTMLRRLEVTRAQVLGTVINHY